MPDRRLCDDFNLRGEVYEIWTFDGDRGNRTLVDPRKNEVVDTDAIRPRLTNDELLSIYDYGRDWD